MTDDAALREVAIHLLALEEHDEPDDATLTWARQALYGEGSEEHRGDCTKEAFTCRRCVRETREAQAAKLIDACLAARSDRAEDAQTARREALEEAARIAAGSQSTNNPLTRTFIAREIRALIDKEPQP